MWDISFGYPHLFRDEAWESWISRWEYKFQIGICKWYVLDFHFDVKVIVAGIQGVFDQNASWISRHIYTKCFIFLCLKNLFLE